MRKLLQIMAVTALFVIGVLPASSDDTLPSSQNELAQQVIQNIRLPEGFEISIFSDQVPGARSLEWTEGGTLFVGTRGQGVVYALRDDDGNFVADGVLQIARGLNSPNGVALMDGSLYVAEINRVLRYDNIEANLSNPPQPVVVTGAYPRDTTHGWKFIRFGPDGKLYIPIGAPCNRCVPNDPRYGTITRINPDGTDFEIVAQGIRNTVGFDWHPITGELYFTDNGPDDLGDNIPSDELNRIATELPHFGFPYCHAGVVPDPDYRTGTCAEFVPPVQQLGPHVAALGMRFYTGEQFPATYQNQIFIAEHGSASRSEKIGYRITLVTLDEDGNAQFYVPFAEGWLLNGQILGRPVDIEQLPDGSILVSDDFTGAIYRIAYVGEASDG